MSTNSFKGNIRNIGGDLHVGDKTTYEQYYGESHKVKFEKISLSDDHFTNFPVPTFATEVVERLRQRKVVLIGGNLSFDKTQFVKYIAHASLYNGEDIKECTNVSDFHKLSKAINEEEGNNILILNYISPTDINFRFKDICRLAEQKNHRLIISTDEPLPSWKLEDEHHKSYWFEIPTGNLYERDVLMKYLNRSLEKNQLEISFDKAEIIRTLESTEQIDHFIRLLADNRKDADVRRLLAESSMIDNSNLQQWFNNLTAHQKLQVIGLTLFEGAYESQFFAGYEELLNRAWRKRDKELRSIDYEDLIPFSAFFMLDEHAIRSKLKDLRKKILQLVWSTHKRYVLSALSVLRDILVESTPESISNWELFRSDDYRDNIRKVISQTFGDVGLHSFADIENTLIQLAAEPEIPSQVAVAQAISRWRDVDEDKVYEILERWEENVEVHRLVQSYLDKRQEYAYISCIQQTVILTLYYTSKYDENGALASKNKALLRRFIKYNDKQVGRRMLLVTDMLARDHPDSMKEMFRDEFLQYDAYVEPIAYGLSRAYNNGSAENIRRIIEEWRDYYENAAEHLPDPAIYTHRDKVLATVIVFLGLIDYSNELPITVKYAYDILENYRKHIHNDTVRYYLIRAMVNIIEANFNANEKISIDVVSNINKAEREYFIDQFFSRFIDQRIELTGGNYEIELVDGRKLEYWDVKEQQPKTDIEVLLKKWESGEFNTLSQIALSTFAKINKFEATQKTLIREYLDDLETERKESEKRRKELEEKNLPVYDGNIEATAETLSFVRACSIFLGSKQENHLRNIAILILQDNMPDDEVADLVARIDDSAGKPSQKVKQVIYVYNLYRDGKLSKEDAPIPQGFKSILFYITTCFIAPKYKRKLLYAFAPFIVSSEMDKSAVNVILEKVNPANHYVLGVIYSIFRNPLAFLLTIIIIFFIFKYIF